jgi:hypothetical protein
MDDGSGLLSGDNLTYQAGQFFGVVPDDAPGCVEQIG